MYQLVISTESEYLTIPECSITKLNYASSAFRFIQDNQPVAHGELQYDRDEAYLEIKYVEVYDKQKGTGTAFVDFLKCLDGIKAIWGESLPCAVRFWNKIGAKFYDSSFQECLNYTGQETEEVQPFEFIIYCI